jgi:hypothetical protein
VLVGAGDIAACNSTDDEKTADLIDAIPGTVFTAGDNVYPDASAADFANCYAPSWGRFKARTRPVIGNHEYTTAGAAPYFDYFGDAAGTRGDGWYAYDLGAWRIYALNANCAQIGGCGPGSRELTWLADDLAANPRACVAAIWHQPRYSSGSEHGNDPTVQPFWDVLTAAGAELVINGHDHDYERFAPMNASGTRDDAAGIRELVVGTGGTAPRGFGAIQPNSVVRGPAGTAGVLQLTLHATGYDWAFVPVAGQTFTDSGSGICH